MAGQQIEPKPSEGRLYLIGVGVTHSIAPPMHNAIARSLSKPWTFSALECPTIASMQAAFHDPSFVGAVITMPYKQAVIPLLAATDPHAALIGAVNNVYRDRSSPALLRGTNTDWEGVRGCLYAADPAGRGRGMPALVIGAGGASRAAVYALRTEFGCGVIYVINRDESEVVQLLADARAYASSSSSASAGPALKIVHVTAESQAQSLPRPFYVVGTVPDIEPRSETEVRMRRILEAFLGAGKGEGEEESRKGVVLDMCFKPRRTRTLKLARETGWIGVEGTEIIGHQIGTQWGLWTGEGADIKARIGEDEAWRVLRREAESSSMIN